SCRPGARPVFPDAVGRWFEQGAGFVDRHGIMEGFPDGTFRGDEGMSRAQAVRMLYRFSGSPVDGARPDHGLSDVPPWIEEAVRWAVAEGIMTGFPDGTFRPDEGLTRAQFTRAMHRVAGSTPTAGLAPHGFTDVPAWVEGEVRWVGLPRESQALAGSSIMTGFPDGTFGPNAFVTRAQAARALSRLAHPASAWSVTFQGTPLDIACYRVGDPPA
ncbi:MAG: S-layer homology domain-containing protein, partial [Actinomycetota bacterium]